MSRMGRIGCVEEEKNDYASKRAMQVVMILTSAIDLHFYFIFCMFFCFFVFVFMSSKILIRVGIHGS